MFWDFIDNYRKARAPEREARDRQYQEQHSQISSQRGLGAVPFQVIGHTLVGAKQGADNISRGLSDFFSAWSDSMNPGHGKIEPMSKREQLASFYKNVDNSVIDFGNPENVDFTRRYVIRDEDTGKSRDVTMGYAKDKNGNYRIAAVLDEDYSEQPFSGKEAIANYFKKTYNMDSGTYTLKDYGVVHDKTGKQEKMPTDANGNIIPQEHTPYSYGRDGQFDPFKFFPSGWR